MRRGMAKSPILSKYRWVGKCQWSPNLLSAALSAAIGAWYRQCKHRRYITPSIDDYHQLPRPPEITARHWRRVILSSKRHRYHQYLLIFLTSINTLLIISRKIAESATTPMRIAMALQQHQPTIIINEYLSAFLSDDCHASSWECHCNILVMKIEEHRHAHLLFQHIWLSPLVDDNDARYS